MHAQADTPELPGIPPLPEPGPHPGEIWRHTRKGFQIEVFAVVRAPAPGWVVGRYAFAVEIGAPWGQENSHERRVFTLEEFREEFARVGR